MTRLFPPAEPLTDGIVTLRVPKMDPIDIDAVNTYAQTDEQRDESWLPIIPFTSADQSVADWLEGWAGRTSHNGPHFVIEISDEQQFIGTVGFKDRDEGVIEMSYAVAPHCRGRGIASRAARLGASWVLRQAHVAIVELRIGQDAIASQHVALNAGFVRDGIVSQLVPATGETFEDLKYVSSNPVTEFVTEF
jgi:ribosomal-protein-alanine N-acetyltransferase